MSDVDSIAWESSYPQALERARREHKLLVVHFSSPDRPLGKTMREEALASPEVVKLSRAEFVNLRLDAHDQADLFATFIGGQGSLASCIVDTTEDVVGLLPGFADASSYLDFLEIAHRGFARFAQVRSQSQRAPTNVVVGLALAEAYDSMGSPRRAEEAYSAVVEKAGSLPKSPATIKVQAVGHERLARLLAARGRASDAGAELARVRAIDPLGNAGRPDRLMLTEALILSLERRLTEAVIRLKELLSRFASSTECEQGLFTLGSIEHELRDDAAGLAHLERLLGEHPQSRWCAAARQQIAHIKNPRPDHEH